MDSPDETWKPVPGYETKYQVSDLGRVRSLPRWTGQRNMSGKVLSPGGQKCYGHETVALGKGNSKTVHSLVMLAFIGPRPHGADILHMNHIPWDNRLDNLRYGTRSENLKMDYAVGARTTPQAWIYSNNGTRKKSHETYHV